MSKAPEKTIIGLGEANLHHDPLLDCLVELSRIHGRPSTRAALSSGLPFDEGILMPSIFHRAASRAGLASKIVRRPLAKIDQSLLPVILLLKNNEACILLGREAESDALLLLFPDTGQGSVTVSQAEIEARYTGIAIFVRPHFRFDLRAPKLAKVVQRHWFWGTLLEQLPLYRDVLAAAFLINIFALALPIFTMNVYDRVVPNYAIETLWMLSAGLLLVLIADYTIRLMRAHFIDLASSRIDLKLSSMIMERVLGMRLSSRPESVGSFAANLRSFETVRDFIASATVTALIDLPFTLLFLLVLGWISWPLLFIPLIGILALVIYSYFVQIKMRALTEQTFRASALRNATLIESLTGLEVIKAQGAESLMQGKWEKTAAYLARVSAKLRLLSASVNNGTASITQLVSLFIVIVGVYLINERELSMGGLIACTMLAGRALAPMGQVSGLLMQFENAKTALSTLESTMNTPGERSDEASFIHRPEIRGEIEFRDVHFIYPGYSEEALRGVSFKIMPGEHVVVLGRVGSGKTTLQKLMMGLYVPSEGVIRLDGVDLRQLDPADLRRNVGYVEQDTMLFYGTMRENITIRAPYADDSAVVAAAEFAGLTEFINRHSEGFDMLIGERGATLSGGQRQGVALARAALLDPPVILFDEPTSSMDFSTEHQFKERLKTFATNKTLVIVTHRTSFIEAANRILVIDDGKIVADGPRGEVLEALQSGRIGKSS